MLSSIQYFSLPREGVSTSLHHFIGWQHLEYDLMPRLSLISGNPKAPGEGPEVMMTHPTGSPSLFGSSSELGDLFLLSFTCPLSIIYCLSISPSIFLVSHCCYQRCCSEDQWMDFFECMSKYVHDRLVEVVFLGQRDSAFQILQSCSPQSLHQLCSPVWTTLPVFPHIFVGSILKTKILRPSYIYCL